MITCQFENGNQANLRHLTLNVMVLRNREVLLGLRQAVPGKVILEEGKWALLGGFMDHGETLEEAAQREVLEESGWLIDQLQLFRLNDNPNRPREDRQNVDIVYLAQAVSQTDQRDQEMSKLSWFPLNALPSPAEFAFDHYDNLALYLRHLRTPYHLPLFGNIKP